MFCVIKIEIEGLEPSCLKSKFNALPIKLYFIIF